MAAVSTPQEVDYSQYLIDPERTIKSDEEKYEPRPFAFITLDDDSQWVVLPDRHKERFCGYLYLREKLSDDSTLQPAENRLFWDGKNIRYLSKYCGSDKPSVFDGLKEKERLKSIGFVDLVNLRKQDGVIYVFDTEFNSFQPEVHEELAGYRKVHDAALAALKARDSAPKDN